MKARYAMLAIAAALMTLATPANAVDLHGYFRSGVGGSSTGGDQVTFKNAGQDYKLRLGNEDNWSEFEFVQLIQKDKNGVEWTAGFMLGWGNGFTVSQDLDKLALQQEYIRATFPQLGGATVWGGKRFYHRSANDIIDFFYMNESGPGVGIEDVDVGFGKLAVALFRFSPAAGSNVVYWMPDFRLEGIAVNPGGTLSIAALAKLRSWNKHTATPAEASAPTDTQSFSPFLMVKHSQSGIMNGGNNLALTFKTGCFVNLSGNISDASGTTVTIPDCHKDLRVLTVSDDLLLQPTKQFSVNIAGVFQNYQFPIGGGEKKTANSYFVGARPLFKVADHFAIQGDVGYFYLKADKATGMTKANTLVKATIAPTITPFTDGFAWGVRPEIRFYATYASWNKEQRATTGLTFGEAGKDVTNGFTFGTQVETWF